MPIIPKLKRILEIPKKPTTLYKDHRMLITVNDKQIDTKHVNMHKKEKNL